MKPIVKTSLVAGAIAVISSVATFFVLGSTTAGKTEFPLFTESGSLHRVVDSDVEKIPDFVSAAESTVNGVVSIKSYSTQTASLFRHRSVTLFLNISLVASHSVANSSKSRSRSSVKQVLAQV